MTLPLNQISIENKPDMSVISLTYTDAKQENRFELTFASMNKLGKKDPRPITGFVVRTKAHGASKHSAGKTKCRLSVSKLTAQEVAGTLSCTGMTDMSAHQAAPDVTDVKFDGKVMAR